MRRCKTPMSPLALALLVLSSLPLATRAQSPAASDGPSVSLSGFGTVGAAISDQPWRYQRYIRDRVSMERDTAFGAQADVQLSPRWSLTVQARLAPAVERDKGWELTPSWAFAAWRPDNEWLLRAGKLRLPFLMRSEQQDLGQTYAEARLPAEIYTLPPTSDFAGGHVARAWSHGEHDLTVEGYIGNSDLTKRFWVRSAVPSPVPGQPPVVPAGELYSKVNVSVAGLVLTWRQEALSVRAAVHQARARSAVGAPMLVSPVWAPLGPGIGYWQTSNQMPGPGVQEVSRVRNDAVTVGAEWAAPAGWQLTGEYLYVRQRDTDFGLGGWAGYATAARSVGAWTPYLTLAAVRSSRVTAEWRRLLDTTTVPAGVPGAALLDASMQMRADSLMVLRQDSLAAGASYRLSPQSRLKVEWLHTRAKQSSLFDLPAGTPLHAPRRVNVLSASYSFAF